jgi:hypothetical protein
MGAQGLHRSEESKDSREKLRRCIDTLKLDLHARILYSTGYISGVQLWHRHDEDAIISGRLHSTRDPSKITQCQPTKIRTHFSLPSPDSAIAYLAQQRIVSFLCESTALIAGLNWVFLRQINHFRLPLRSRRNCRCRHRGVLRPCR